MQDLLFIDFETFFDTKQDYDLRSISMSEYIRDVRFKSFGAALAFNKEKAVWLNHEQLIEEFKTINWDNVSVVSHNAKFDHAILVWRYGIHPHAFYDTLSMVRAVLGTKIRKFSLASVAQFYGFEPKGNLQTNGLRELTVHQEKELGEYCEHDTDLCRDIFYKLCEEFPKSQFWHMDWTIKAFVYPRLVLDVPLLQQTAIRERNRRNNIFKEIGIEKKIFSSNDKFAELLTKEGYEVPTKTSPATGKSIPAFALGDEAFHEMVNSEDERMATLCEARIAAKSNLLETRSEKLARVGTYGKFPVDVQFSGATQTHRYSGGSGGGGNFQNFTKGSALRRSVTVNADESLIVADLSNIEFRIVSYLANDPILIGMIENKIDIYCDFASKIYKRTITKKDKKERQFGKTAILGLGYGMGWEKFQKQVKKDCGFEIDEKFAKATVYFYRSYYKAIPALWEKLDIVLSRMVAGKRGDIFDSPSLFYDKTEIILPSGLKLRYPNLHILSDEYVYHAFRKKEEAMTVKIYGGKLLENISQALAGEILKENVSRIVNKGINVSASIHDEVLCVVPKDKVVETMPVVYTCMTEALQYWPKLRLEAEVNSGSTWLEAK
jgi:hypothetical protein